MLEVRSVVYLGFLFLSVVIFSLPLVLLGWMLPFPIIARLGKWWGRSNLYALEWICGLKYRIVGSENLPSEPSVILCKHQSAWETIALRGLLPLNHTWVLKKELLKVPLFGWALLSFQPIAIDRKAGRHAVRQLLHEGRHWISRGRSVVVFPEGTRVAPGQRKRYGMGGALLACSVGAPVVPIAHNAGIYWGRRSIRKYPGCIDVVVGKPISVNDMKAAELSRLVEDWIESTVESLPHDRRR